MYDVRGTRYDLKACARCAGDAERKRSGIFEATLRFSYDAAVRLQSWNNGIDD